VVWFTGIVSPYIILSSFDRTLGTRAMSCKRGTVMGFRLVIMHNIMSVRMVKLFKHVQYENSD
jgi:hypothetical protein